MSSDPAWVHGHPHEPNPAPPTADATLILCAVSGAHEVSVEHAISIETLRALPTTRYDDCYIVSTGHGTSGPFCFAGVHLRDLLAARDLLHGNWAYVDVVSADGFGNRVQRSELLPDEGTADLAPILLAHTLDGAPLTREAGLVRLIVPTERDDALRQVKWVAHIYVVGSDRLSNGKSDASSATAR